MKNWFPAPATFLGWPHGWRISKVEWSWLISCEKYTSHEFQWSSIFGNEVGNELWATVGHSSHFWAPGTRCENQAWQTRRRRSSERIAHTAQGWRKCWRRTGKVHINILSTQESKICLVTLVKTLIFLGLFWGDLAYFPKSKSIMWGIDQWNMIYLFLSPRKSK